MSEQVNNSGSNNSYNEFIPDQLPEIDEDSAKQVNQTQPETVTKEVQYFESDVQSVGDILQSSGSTQYSPPVIPNIPNNYSEPKKSVSLKKTILFSALLGVFCAVILIIIISLN
jgi:hypothetical protein